MQDSVPVPLERRSAYGFRLFQLTPAAFILVHGIDRQPYSVIGVCRVGKGVVTYKN